MSVELRPLSLGELLDRCFTLYRRHFVTFVAIMAVPSVAMLGVLAAITLLEITLTAPPGTEPDPARLTLALVLVVPSMAVLTFAYWVAYIAAMGATAQGVSEVYAGRTPGATGGYRAVRHRIGPLLLMSLLIVLRVGGLFLLFVGIPAGLAALLGRSSPVLAGLLIVAGVLSGSLLASLLALRYALAVPAVMLEATSASGAIRRSIDLTRGQMFRVFLVVLCAMMVAYAALMIFQMPFIFAAALAGPESTAGFWLNLGGSLMGAVGSALTSPFLVIGLGVLYFDARIRREAFDLQLMTEALGGGDTGASVTASPALPG